MITTRTPEEEAAFQQFLVEATAMIVEMNRRISAQAEKETTFCAAGCTACCHQIFHLSSTELNVILRRLESDSELRAKFDEQNAVRKKLIEEKIETIKEISKIPENLHFGLAWNALKIPCALLHDGKCLVYDIRPGACSTYLTLSPPRVCAIDPKGYLSREMAKLKDEFGAAINRVNAKYGVSSEMFFDLSWHLDNCLNPLREVVPKKNKRKKS